MNRQLRLLILATLSIILVAITVPVVLSTAGALNATPAPDIDLPPVAPTITPGPAPQLPLQGLDGAMHTLEEWQGRTVLLNYWATWCIPCRSEMPLLARYHESRDDVTVIGVNYREDWDAAQDYVDELALPFPILLDEDAELAKRLGVLGLPTTYLIDRSGRLVTTHIGELDEAEIEALLGLVE